jgi:hypothetical protein
MLPTLALAGTAGAQTLRPGVMTGSIPSISSPAHQYAVYVPSGYDPQKPAPIMFILDYRGRARVAAEVFIPAAERFGWILMSSSNTVSDEGMKPTLDALRAMWIDADDLFTIDPKRTYLAGLSGTARIATWVAAQKPATFAGVIGAAAGFAELAPPSATLPFVYYGTVGSVDYNYWEMRQLEERLAGLQLPHRVNYFFDGGHGWMPPDVAMKAVEWMELRAMKSGLRTMDKALVDAFWRADLGEVLTLEKSGRVRAAMRALESIGRDYGGLQPDDGLAEIAAHRDKLAADPAIAREARTAQASARSHALRIAAAMQTIADAFPVDDGAPTRSLGQTLLDLEVPALQRAAAGSDQAVALAARRVLAELNVQTGFYLPVAAMAGKDDARAKFYLDIAQRIDPEDSYAWFLRAKVLARLKRNADAIDALTSAVGLGFRSPGLLETDSAFKDLRARPDFQFLLEQVRARWIANGSQVP